MPCTASGTWLSERLAHLGPNASYASKVTRISRLKKKRVQSLDAATSETTKLVCKTRRPTCKCYSTEEKIHIVKRHSLVATAQLYLTCSSTFSIIISSRTSGGR